MLHGLVDFHNESNYFHSATNAVEMLLQTRYDGFINIVDDV